MLPKTLSLLLLGGGLTTTGFGLAVFHVAAIVLGVGLIGLAAFLDQRLERRHNEKLSAEIASRVAELTQRPWHSHETLKVHGGLSLAVGMMLFALASAYSLYAGIGPDAVRWPLVLGGAFFLALIVLALPIFLAGVGKPLLELDRDGFKMPIHGRIPWRAVSGIDLSPIASRRTAVRLLFFRVAPYRNAVASIHWSQRLLAFFGLGPLPRGVVGAQLPPSKEHPEVVYGVAQFLWKQATGRDHRWNSMRSDDYNEAVRRLTTAPRLPDPDAIENPETVLAALERASKDFEVVRNEHARDTTRLYWLLGAAVIVLALSFAWPWLSRP